MIIITRDSGWVDRARAYKVSLDGKVIGKVKNGQEIQFDVPPGKHKLHLKLDWCRSNIVEFEVLDGPVEFECGSNLRGFRSLLAVLYATILYHK